MAFILMRHLHMHQRSRLRAALPNFFCQWLPLAQFIDTSHILRLGLFYMAKAMFLEGQRQKRRNAIKRLGNKNSGDYMARRAIIEEIHCLLCLVTFATWQKDPDLKNEWLGRCLP